MQTPPRQLGNSAGFSSLPAAPAVEWPVPARRAGAGTSVASRAPRRAPGVPLLERIAALLGLVAVSPLMALVAAAIKIESPRGPVFFRQERVGLDRRQGRGASGPAALAERRKRTGYGQSFQIFKFRTMIPEAERQTGPVWASAHDPRVTRVGRILRDMRIDELPQLLNVVLGQMRLIGPRPERPHFVEQLVRDIPDYLHRLRIFPGITGLAQVEREYDSDVADVRKKLAYDLFYARHRCGLMDIKILLKTVRVVLARKGAH